MFSSPLPSGARRQHPPRSTTAAISRKQGGWQINPALTKSHWPGVALLARLDALPSAPLRLYTMSAPCLHCEARGLSLHRQTSLIFARIPVFTSPLPHFAGKSPSIRYGAVLRRLHISVMERRSNLLFLFSLSSHSRDWSLPVTGVLLTWALVLLSSLFSCLKVSTRPR